MTEEPEAIAVIGSDSAVPEQPSSTTASPETAIDNRNGWLSYAALIGMVLFLGLLVGIGKLRSERGPKQR
ncbi:MAG: hypothetical protein R3C44_06185 [Chloroflexota bacterium]